jgi:hypothetical protein
VEFAFCHQGSDYRRRQLHKLSIQGYKAMASQAQFVKDLALWDTILAFDV